MAPAKIATPAKAAPAKTAATKAAPAKAAPAKATETKATPAKEAPAKSAAKVAPAKSATEAKSATPAKSAPAKSAPAKSAPAKSAPAKSAPAKSAPAKSAPDKPAPARNAATTRSAPAPARSTAPARPTSPAAPNAAAPRSAATGTTGQAAESRSTATGSTAQAAAPRSATTGTTGTRPAAANATAAPTRPAPQAPARPEGTVTQALRAETAELPIVEAVRSRLAAEAAIEAAHAEVAHTEVAPPEVAQPEFAKPEVANPEITQAEVTQADEATAEIERPALRRAAGRTGGVVQSTRPPAEVRPPAVVRTPVLPDPAITEAAPPLSGLPTSDPRLVRPPAGAPVILPPPDADVTVEAAPEKLSPSARKMLQRRRLVMLVALVLLAVIVLVIGQFVRTDDGRRVANNTPGVSAGAPGAGVGEATVAEPTAAVTTVPAGAVATKAASQAPADAADTSPTKAAAGTAGAFTFAAGYGPVLGNAGTLRRFKVSVEKTLGQGNGGDFADEIDRTLGDPRSWIAGRQYRLQRVPESAASEFTIYLASAKSSEKMCATGGLQTEGYTSCRLPGQVIINDDRWQDAVPDYNAPLETYRAYTINHEVGHQLGYGHEGCSGKGRPAPVMQQQTYGLKGCVANSWPYIDGKRYAGPPIE